MAAPNLKNPTTINGKTARANITGTSIVGVVTNAGSSGKALKINSLFENRGIKYIIKESLHLKDL